MFKANYKYDDNIYDKVSVQNINIALTSVIKSCRSACEGKHPRAWIIVPTSLKMKLNQ